MEYKIPHDSPEWLNVQCAICGKRFHLKPYKAKLYENHYCSPNCHLIGMRNRMSGDKNHQYGLRGEKNDSWKGGKRKTGYGYTIVQCLGHPFAWSQNSYVFEHRLVAEKYLLTEENSVEIDGKRYLSPDYIVHHINGDRQDNRPENLEIMKKSEHSSRHEKEYMQYRNRDKLGRFAPGSVKEIARKRKGA